MQHPLLRRLASGLPPTTARWGRLLALLALLLGSSFGAWAQSVANYVPVRNTGVTYASIAATGNAYTWRNGTNTDDDLSTTTPIGFTFVYDGLPYTQFSVSTNGFLTFNTGTTATGSGSSAYGFANTTFSTAGSTVTTLAPFYSDQQTANNAGTLADLNASLRYLTTGTVGNRVLTAEWINIQDFNTTSTSSFNYQVKLYEADGHIEFNYGTMTFGNSGTLPTTYVYTLGINSPTGGATAANLLTLQTGNTNTFSSTASNALPYSAAPTANSQYTFTAPQPAAPITLTFTAVTAGGMTVNFVDNSTTENKFLVQFSTDNTFTTYSQGTVASTTAATTGTAYTATLTGLTASTTYYVRISSIAEVNSPALTGSQATTVAFVFNNSPYTIDNTMATGGTNFASFTDAINALNPGTLTGPLIFNVAAGQTFAEAPPAITKSGSAGNTITFQKSGTGANPTIAPALNTGVGAGDYIVGIFGADTWCLMAST